MDMQIIVSPLVGALIGYITNAIAIKMLFRPAKPVYIGKFRLPLTPGLIPKEKARLARSIGDVVGRELLCEEAVRDALLSEEMCARVRQTVRDLIARGEANESTLMDCLSRFMTEEGAAQTVKNTKSFAAKFLTEKLLDADLGMTAARSMTEGVKKRTPGPLNDIVHQLLSDRVKQGVIAQLQGAINGYVERHAEELVTTAIEREADKLMSARVCDLLEQNRHRLDELTERIVSLYSRIVEASIHNALSAIDLPAIVRTRIESIDDGELEGLILGVANRELKAIVYLGALLGFVMGFITLLFP